MPETMARKISVVIPVYNERDHVTELVRRVRAVSMVDEVVIVDDCSTDGTSEILAKLAHEEGLRLFRHEHNLGKGGALRTGFAKVTGDIIIIQDSDLEYDPQEYSRLVAPIIEGKADVVYGSRFIGSDPHRAVFFWHMMGNKFLTFLSNMFTNLNLTDMETCYKAFTREVLEQLVFVENRFGFEPEFTARVARLKARIYEVGISYAGRTYDEGKKIGWKDGISAIRCIVKYNLFP